MSRVGHRRRQYAPRFSNFGGLMRKLLLAIVLPLAVAGPILVPRLAAYETIAGVTEVKVHDDQVSPVISYWTPTYLDETANDISYWILFAERQRVTGATNFKVNFEVHHREERLRQITTTTLDGGGALAHGPAKDEKSCTPTCEYLENVVMDISADNLKALAGETLRIKVDTAQGWSKVIEFPGDIIQELLDKTGI